jgi:hypothetical protein
MIVEAKCKVCGRPIHLEVDDHYGKLGDPFGLMKLATCMVCIQNRFRKRAPNPQQPALIPEGKDPF